MTNPNYNPSFSHYPFTIFIRHLNLTKDGNLNTDDVLAKEKGFKMVGLDDVYFCNVVFFFLSH